MRSGGQRRRTDTVGSMVGDRLQRRHRPDYQIVLYMGLLMMLGLIIMYAIGPQRAQVLNSAHQTTYYTSTYFIIKQAASLLVALAAFVVMMLVPFRILMSHATKVLFAGIGASLLLAIIGDILHVDSIAHCSLGACRWFDLGPLGSFQPSELLKFGVLGYLAGFIGMRIRQGRLNDISTTIVPVAVVTGVGLFFTIFAQKDMGTGIALVTIVISMLMVAGIDKKLGVKLLAILLAVGIIGIISAPHRIERVMTFFQGDNLQSVDDNDYHIKHAKIAIGSGGLLGVGIGNSVQATGYLPEAINDSVFAIMGETFGFVGLVVILLIFTALLFRVLRISDHLTDPAMRLFVAGAFGWLAAHVVLNIASMLGVFPLTGITLPLLSFGGTSMILISAALGVVFQLSRYTSHESLTKGDSYESVSSRRRLGRSRYSDYRRTR